MKVGLSCVGIDGGAVAGEPFKDLLGGLVPYERCGVLVPGGSPRLDVGREVLDVAMSAALQLLGGERRKPAFDEVHPRSVGRGEVEMEPAVAEQPLVDRWRLV